MGGGRHRAAHQAPLAAPTLLPPFLPPPTVMPAPKSSFLRPHPRHSCAGRNRARQLPQTVLPYPEERKFEPMPTSPPTTQPRTPNTTIHPEHTLNNPEQIRTNLNKPEHRQTPRPDRTTPKITQNPPDQKKPEQARAPSPTVAPAPLPPSFLRRQEPAPPHPSFPPPNRHSCAGRNRATTHPHLTSPLSPIHPSPLPGGRLGGGWDAASERQPPSTTRSPLPVVPALPTVIPAQAGTRASPTVIPAPPTVIPAPQPSFLRRQEPEQPRTNPNKPEQTRTPPSAPTR